MFSASQYLKFALAGAILTVMASPVGSVSHAAVITLQPIQVRNSDGTGGATVNLNAAATQKIWAQAGIDVVFLPLRTFDATQFLVLEDSTEITLLRDAAGNGANSNPSVLNVWFVDTIASQFGAAVQGGNGTAIAATPPVGSPRIDTLAHMIGHNLGLSHVTDVLNLMDTILGPVLTIDDIAPDGIGGARLDQAQISDIFARTDLPFIVDTPAPIPLPAAAWMFLTALGGLGLFRWRRRASA